MKYEILTSENSAKEFLCCHDPMMIALFISSQVKSERKSKKKIFRTFHKQTQTVFETRFTR